MTDLRHQAPGDAEHPDDSGPGAAGLGASGPQDDAIHREAAAEQRSALVRLALILAAGAIATIVAGVGKTVLVVLAIILMIMLHEGGHFLMAKLGHMKVTEYFLGFGPRLWSFRRGETEYGIKAIPAGGYVKIPGMSNLEEVDPEDEPRTYRQQPFWPRFGVAVAGSTTHFLLAIILLWGLIAFVGQPDPHKVKVGELIALENGPSPAQEAGFRPGDLILTIDGRAVRSIDDVANETHSHPGQPVTFVIRRHGQDLTITATPTDLSKVQVKGVPATAEPTGFVGIGMDFGTSTRDPVTAVGQAGRTFGSTIWLTMKALGGLFSPHGMSAYANQLTGSTPSGSSASPPPRLLSPVGFVRVASQAAHTGFYEVLNLLILINIFVGVFNLIPLLPLDGGHVAIAIYEAVRSRRGRRYHADVAKLLPVTYFALLVIVFLGMSSLYLDIVHPLANPFR